MNYLELCQKVARESGITSGLTVPLTVNSQTGTLKGIVGWTADAWNDVQVLSQDWRWMRGEYEKTLLADLGTYSPAGMAAVRHAKWITNSSVTISDPADATGRESFLKYIPWTTFRTERLVGVSRSVRRTPIEWSIDPQDQFVMWPTPDIVYTIRGEYQKAPQTLALDTDIPEIPVAHHDLIWKSALVILAVQTESMEQLAQYVRQAASARVRLFNAQLPRISFDDVGAIA
ncbi:MAG: hypothetical protein ACJA1L_001544 [Paracoccaceae bacterium]|jgi:hypothetical protein